jgi:hypothetical protein
MFNKNIKAKLEQRLYRRGMLQGASGNVIKPAKRKYKTLGEEILWILNQEKLSLPVSELANYLDADKKTIQKVMRKLTSSSINLVKKNKSNSVFVYSVNFNKDLDIPTIYKMARMAG